MKKLHSVALCAILAPALAFATGSAIAQEPRTTTEREQAQRQNPDEPQSRDMGRPSTQPSRPDEDRPISGDRPSQAATGQRTGHGTFLASKPTRGFHTDELIGADVKAQASGDELGEISDLIIDENGKVVAVIVGVGGFLGLGEKDVAIGWDALQRTAKSGGDGYDYRLSATRDSLTNAPEYKKSD